MYKFPQGLLNYPLTSTRLSLQASDHSAPSLILTFRASRRWVSCLFLLITLEGNEIVLLQNASKI